MEVTKILIIGNGYQIALVVMVTWWLNSNVNRLVNSYSVMVTE
jgi:hypothetical protein